MRPAPIALATLFFYGCAAVQVRGAAAPPEPEVAPAVALERPLLDLWVEGAGSVSEPERERAVAEAEKALAAALEGRGFAPAAEADAVLTVRAQGLAQTEGRRSSRVAVMTGIFVLVAAVVVVLAAASGKGGGRVPAVGGAGKAAPAPVRGTAGGAGRVASAPPRAGAPFPGGATPAPPRDGVSASRPARAGGFVSGGLQIDVQLPAPVEPVQPTFERRLAERGLFDGEEIEVILELWDLGSGELLFSRAVHGEVDPRNAGEVRALVDRALAGQPWAQPGTRPGPPSP
jgi:hypothetical protein